MKQWQYGSDLITDWVVGSHIRYRTEWDGAVVEQWGHVEEFRPTSLIRHTLYAPREDLEDKPENYFTMNYVLEEAEGVTTLTVIQDDPRPPAAPPGESEEGEEGENPVLQALKALLESRQSRAIG